VGLKLGLEAVEESSYSESNPTAQMFYILTAAARILYTKHVRGKVFLHKLIVAKLAKIFP
jgi:hypothetical protein